MAMSLARPMIRSPALRMAARRFESTATAKATEAAKDTASKAQQGLSRVAAAAGPAIAGAARGVGNALSKVGGRTGRLIAFVERECKKSIVTESKKSIANTSAQVKPPLSCTIPRLPPRLPSWCSTARR